MKNKKLLIYGNGSIAKLLLEYIRLQVEVVGFTVDGECMHSDELLGLPLVPFESVEQCYPPSEYDMIIAVGYVDMNSLRNQRYKEAKIKGYSFINYIHQSVVIHPSLVIGENNIILDHVSIHPFTTIGNSNFISSNSNFGHDCCIQDNCWINAGISIAGETTIMSNCFMGVNASVGHRVIIEERTFIGANTFVGSDTAQGAVYLSPGGEMHRMKSDSFMRFTKM